MVPGALSSRALFNIATASALEKFGGRTDLRRAECEMNHGDGGSVRFVQRADETLSGLSLCRGGKLGRGLFNRGFELDVAFQVTSSPVLACFVLFVSVGVAARVMF